MLGMSLCYDRIVYVCLLNIIKPYQIDTANVGSAVEVIKQEEGRSLVRLG